MKKLLSILLLFTTISGFGQSFKVQLESFDELKVARGVKASLFKSSSKEMTFELKGISEDDIIIEQNNHRLTIKVRTKSLWELMQDNDWSVKVKIPYQSIELIDVSTGAVVSAENVIESDDLFIDSNMGGVVKLEVKTQRITIDTNMGSVIQIKGETVTVNIDSNMGSVVKAYNLVAKIARVKVSMGGVVKVNCTEEFDGSASMGGDIGVKGNPKKWFEKGSMGGDIYHY